MYKYFKTSIRSLLSSVSLLNNFFFIHIIKIFRHISSGKNVNNSKKSRRSQKRHSAPPASNQSKKNRYRSPFQAPVTTATPENGTNGNQSDEYETPKKVSKFL